MGEHGVSDHLNQRAIKAVLGHHPFERGSHRYIVGPLLEIQTEKAIRMRRLDVVPNNEG